MDVMIKLTIPNYIFRFYQDASRHVADSSPEHLMADALCAYAGLLSEPVAQIQKSLLPTEESSDGYPEISKSR